MKQSLCIFDVTRNRRMGKNRILRKRGLVPSRTVGCFQRTLRGHRCRHQTAQRRSEYLLPSSYWRGVPTFRSVINTDTLTSDGFSTHPVQNEHPTKSGVCITFDQWDVLKKLIEKLHKQKPYLLGAIPCHRRPHGFDDIYRM